MKQKKNRKIKGKQLLKIPNAIFEFGFNLERNNNEKFLLEQLNVGRQN